MPEAFITVLFTSPLPVALAILGVLCVGLAIVGQIPSMHIRGVRALTLGAFGILLIISAIVAAWLIALASGPPPAIATVTSSQPVEPTATISSPGTQPTPDASLPTEIANVPPTTCVPDVVINHDTPNPLYKRPEGYGSGWITSDPSDLVLPDGTVVTILERYVLVVEDLPEVQILDVALGPIHSNTWGCWFRIDLTQEVLPGAEDELRKMRAEAPSVTAEMYRLSSEGLEKLDK